ncbi:interferon-inducible GTPase 5 [Ornithorhynchus anatinus]|uniref:interferon-inducible GTPase 5 n=1 Tax=Ornithorhynchus anatinus TaxID=9258 RepID=UPI0001554CB0|nr:interferon-inducible GTPase 5 [Ornithorhynchus anatinus]
MEPQASRPSGNQVPPLNPDAIREFTAALGSGNVPNVARKLMEAVKMAAYAKLNVAVTGEPGAGKSTFINAMRQLGDEDPGAAATGVVDTTRDPTPYPHPKYPNITLWDLPGIGSPEFRAEGYLARVASDRYDFFILLASQRFTYNLAQLACAIQQQGKKFYLVRCKVDVDLEASRRRRPSSFDPEQVLAEIRRDCQDQLSRQGLSGPRVFALSNFNRGLYDFPLLEETLEKELPGHKRQAFLLARPNDSLEVLEKKKAALEEQIWKLALAACTVNSVPVPGLPGLPAACEVAILTDSLSDYCRSFGLERETLEELARELGLPQEEVQGLIRSPLAQDITRGLVLQLLASASQSAQLLFQYFRQAVPTFGTLAAAGLSFAAIYLTLRTFLQHVAEDARRIVLLAQRKRGQRDGEPPRRAPPAPPEPRGSAEALPPAASPPPPAPLPGPSKSPS